MHNTNNSKYSSKSINMTTIANKAKPNRFEKTSNMNKNYYQHQHNYSYHNHYQNNSNIATSATNSGGNSRYYPQQQQYENNNGYFQHSNYQQPQQQVYEPTNYRILTKNDIIQPKKRDSIVSIHKTLSTVSENEVSTNDSIVALKIESLNENLDVNSTITTTAIDCYVPTTIQKLPLHCTWSFWYIKNDRLKNWKDNLIKLIDFSYVEDFWSIYNYLVNPSQLETGTDLALFKTGIEPMWEDPENKTGGRWLLTFNSSSSSSSSSQQQQHKSSSELDDIWLDTVLALIGDNFCGLPNNQDDLNKIKNEFNENSDHICDSITGICVQNRPKIDKLSLWTKNYKKEALTRYIGRKWKENASIRQTITFEPHDSQYSKSSNSKLIYKE